MTNTDTIFAPNSQRSAKRLQSLARLIDSRRGFWMDDIGLPTFTYGATARQYTRVWL